MGLPTQARHVLLKLPDLGERPDELRSDGIVYRIHDRSGVVLTTASGVVDAHHVFDHIRRLANDPLVDKPIRELFDGSAITRLGLGTNDVRRIARMLTRDCPCFSGARLAAVATRPLHFGLTRMLQAFVGDELIHIEVFRSREPAAVWIGCRE